MAVSGSNIIELLTPRLNNLSFITGVDDVGKSLATAHTRRCCD